MSLINALFQKKKKKKKIRYIGPVSKKVKDIIGFSYYSSSDYRNFSSLICGNNCFFRFKQIKERKFRFKHSPDRLLEHSKQPKVVLSGGANVQSRGSIDPCQFLKKNILLVFPKKNLMNLAYWPLQNTFVITLTLLK